MAGDETCLEIYLVTVNLNWLPLEVAMVIVYEKPD
jgi:hypothetical protein